jgi:uncharacterized RDD family membrane protein YckC
MVLLRRAKTAGGKSILRMGRYEEPLDATIRVVTPENIAFEYRLAGPFRRLPAFLLDFCVGFGLLVTLLIIINMTVTIASPGLAAALSLLLFFVIWWFYGVLFETFMNGQTPGKYVLGLRVLTDSGQPINGMQATLRNLLRAADLLIPLLGIVVMTLNRKYQRLGDLVAGTIVVTRSLAKSLATYVERRRFFTPPRRREVARHLAIPLLERFGLPPDTSYDLLLCALYYRTFIADRSQDERLLAEAQAAFAANNPFAHHAANQRPPAPPYVPPPLAQDQMAGTGFGSGR